MSKYIVAASLTVAIATPAFAWEDVPVGSYDPFPIQVSVADLKALVANAERHGEKSAWIGAPVWHFPDHSNVATKPPFGVYLDETGNIRRVDNEGEHIGAD